MANPEHVAVVSRGAYRSAHSLAALVGWFGLALSLTGCDTRPVGSGEGQAAPERADQTDVTLVRSAHEVYMSLGLALARQVMTAHGGFIRVGQNEGGGAKFTLTF